MKLSDKDKKMLLNWGYRKSDLEQIEVATSLTRYEFKGRLISDAMARSLLGDREYLSGISRSAFHWSATRYTPTGEGICFDSSALFKD